MYPFMLWMVQKSEHLMRHSRNRAGFFPQHVFHYQYRHWPKLTVKCEFWLKNNLRSHLMTQNCPFVDRLRRSRELRTRPESREISHLQFSRVPRCIPVSQMINLRMQIWLSENYLPPLPGPMNSTNQGELFKVESQGQRHHAVDNNQHCNNHHVIFSRSCNFTKGRGGKMPWAFGETCRFSCLLDHIVKWFVRSREKSFQTWKSGLTTSYISQQPTLKIQICMHHEIFGGSCNFTLRRGGETPCVFGETCRFS